MAAGLLSDGAAIGTKLTEERGASVIPAKAVELNTPPASGSNGAPAIKPSIRRRFESTELVMVFFLDSYRSQPELRV